MKHLVQREGTTERGLGSEPVLTRPALARRDHVFYTGVSVAFLVTALVGFAPTYFLKAAFPTRPLSPLLHVHGLICTTWLVLLLAQTALVARGHVALHMKLGVAGALVAATLVPVGLMTAVATARQGTATPERLAFLIFPLTAVLMFGGFIAAALWNRRKPERHRRLILLGTATLITPAIARLPFVAGLPLAGLRPVLALLLSTMFVGAAMLHDWRAGRRAHPLYVWGGVAILLSGPLRFALAHTAAWQSIARFLVDWRGGFQ